MTLRDRAFMKVFASTFVYTILYEDAEVDETVLELDENSRVLSITGAGCGVAGMISRRPTSIDAVDINKHHLALTALKVTAAKHAESYADFYDLLGRGWAADPKGRLAGLMDKLPDFAASYWAKNSKRFKKSLYHQGMTARMLAMVRKTAGIDEVWARRVASLPVAERVVALRETLAPLQGKKSVRAFLDSPVQLVALGINHQQKARIQETEQQHFADAMVTYLSRVVQTDLATNWFYWFATTGGFDHRREDAVPPYLRRDRFEKSQGAPTQMNWHRGNLFELVESAERGQWTHATLCDAVDWMPTPVQRRLFDGLRRAVEPGGTVLIRSVDDDDPVEEAGAAGFLIKQPISEWASKSDRSCQYRQVNVYRVAG
jgi:S-adenosylmethionine-diacylglycerol 3-amino-3-carboxypropyl transferase